MDLWLVWLIIAALLGIAEIFTLTAALGILGAAALLTAGIALLGLPLGAQLLVFAAASTAGIVVVRPIARRLLRQPAPQRFGVSALIGKPAYVIKEVTAHDGRVRIGGEEWSARAYDESLVIPVGTTVDVIQIEGATALVYPRE
ncbi:membrane protein [Thermobispora bispora]|jgi:membrane protein implicated in regulation of membrane protease activity|uniref:NfeD family protein n=1 Tax=Thermobispora bispora TaxID=2006 RepID=UPI0019814206|nr:NfeD family protein [Thermobispora bispora]MBO2474891.1 hypothetical protein [Actinomycetales bacterium]MBX6168820.1 NfeD family protein [Thermobispora bispora]MDI9579410.1 NfeD family protein [Thermobispora sp.]QSI49522.1 NfeD family protein [Thermobispora bispora]